MIDTDLKPITAIYPRTLATSQHRVIEPQYDGIETAVDKLRRDLRAWVKPGEVDQVLQRVQTFAQSTP